MSRSTFAMDFRKWMFVAGIRAVILCGIFLSAGRMRGQADKNPAPPVEDQAPFKLKAGSNLVVVRVVVRDAQGKPVEGLKKEDFKLFDRGKEQAITQFEATSTSTEAPPIPSGESVTEPNRKIPAKRFLALYFDDLNMSDADVIDARDAADHYLTKNLQPDERVALFTSSAVLSDFTADLKQIHDALFRLHPHPHGSSHSDCPVISDYQAKEIDEHDNPNTSEAWKVALDEAVNRCNMPKSGGGRGDPPAPSNAAPETVALVRNLARSILAESEIQARTDLQALDQIVNTISRAPGKRSIILVSPGFLSQSEQYKLDRIIDRALRADVVISSLDPRGLALIMREADVTNGYMPTTNSGVVGAQHMIDTNREMVAGDVLAEVAAGTGGEFFRNNNDLNSGFRALAGSQGAYTLAFAPTDAKQDGKFHPLKVSLTEDQRGLRLQARRGYYAVKEGAVVEEDRPQLETRPQPAPAADPAAQDKERVHQALISETNVQEFPVEVHTEISKGADNNDVAVLVHVDTKTLHFHKEVEHNQNTITFMSVILDENGKYLAGQQRQAKVDVPDVDLPKFSASGVDIKIMFQLKPGTYTLREVVTDSEEHHLSAQSLSVVVQ